MTIACTLEASERDQRRHDWHALVATASAVQSRPDGVRLVFGRDADVARIAGLAAAENDCCRFFTFTLCVTAAEVSLHVAAPAEARPLVDELLAPG